ncbi:MAG: CDP-glycerol glycerophosphotransferase family protein [Clostridia bacterium]|nr:CDP-glycerol glycerophosphotransferase family protein [Clostridia bacterium]
MAAAGFPAVKGVAAHVCDLTAEPTGDLLCAADVLLTDYSSVLFDASLLGVPTVFYCPDRRTYERSFYLDLDRDLPGPLTESADDVLPLLRQVREAPPAERIRAFCARQTAACDGRSTARVAALIRAYLE